jgi:hypothetical protein
MYAGEDLFFANLAGGFYLVAGGEPGTRQDDTSGALVALRLNANPPDLGAVSNLFVLRRMNPNSSDSALSEADAAVFSKSSLQELIELNAPFVTTVVADSSPVVPPSRIRWMSPETLRTFQLEYAWTPYPLARVSAVENGDTAEVTRTFELGPLSISGQRESWRRDAAGDWTLSAVLARWKI